MKQVTSSFWFWLLILGAFLILLAALLGGGLKEINGWVGALFITGIVLTVLGIIFAIVAWVSFKPTECSKKEKTSCPYSSSPSNSTFVSSSGMSQTMSPIGTPTKSSYNIPQSRRGFATTDANISSLAP